MELDNKKCKSVREFFEFLIKSGQLLESQKKYDEKSHIKYINGRVTANGKNVVSGLDWSKIRARQFCFNNDPSDSTPLVSSYDKLPTTSYGISGDLPMPDNILEFLQHNAYGHFLVKKDKITVQKNICIVPMRDMNLSNLEVVGNVMWHGGKIRLSQLPKVSGKIYSLKKEHIISEKNVTLNPATLARLHVRLSDFLETPATGVFRGFLQRYF